MTDKTISVISFGGGFNLPLWAAQTNGLFDRHGVAITLQFTADSRQVFSGLGRGDYHIAITALDNVVAYQEGHTESLGDQPNEFFAFMGSDEGFLSLVSAPDVPNFEALRGRSISVDDPASGFSMLLREMLRRNGLESEDVQLERAGGTDRRYADLLAGRHAATMLRTPFDLMAVEKGFHNLGGTVGTIGPYMGIVGASHRQWAAANEASLVAFIRAYRDGVKWLKTPGNRPQAEQLLRENVPTMSKDLASLACRAMLDPTHGFFDDVRLDHAGVAAVLALRTRFRVPENPLVEPARYIDERYWHTAQQERD